MKDYYQILQIHKEANTKEIQAAYRQLMRKYHPDVLPPHFRDDPDVLQKAKNINEAFEVLRDPAKREEYDKIFYGYKFENPYDNNHQFKDFESSFILVRCGQTKGVFKGFLIREINGDTPFILLGFDPVPNFSLPEKRSILKRISRRFRSHSQSLIKSNNLLDFESYYDEKINEELNKPPSISMGDIHWGQHTCPDCAGSIQNENGTKATFIGCSKCGRVRCAGGVKETKSGQFSTCPWCDKTNKLTRSVPTGKKDHLQLHGFKTHRESRPQYKNIEGGKPSAKLSDENEN